jgi:hypothetical protein
MRLLAPQSAQQSPERCLHLDVLLFNVLNAEDAPVHHVLVVVQQRVGLQCNRVCVTLLCVIGVRKSNVDFTYPIIRVEISVVGCTRYRAAKEKIVC